MKPIIKSGQKVTVAPIKDPKSLKVGDIVLVKVSGHFYLHKIGAIREQGCQYRIENGKGHINGWASCDDVYGKLKQIYYG